MISPAPLKQKEKIQQFLSFQMPGGSKAMLPTHQLTEILSLNLSQIVPISDSAASLLGVCNWRGEVLWLVDLGALLGLEPLYNQTLRLGKLNVIVVHHQEQMLGLGVERVDQMLWCDPNSIQPSPATHVTPEFGRCVQGYWSAPPEDMILVLDAEAVMDCLD